MAGFLADLFWWVPFGSVPEISSKELQKKIMNKKTAPNLIDVRTVAEWNGGHIAKTLNVPLGLIRAQTKALPFEKEEPIVVICRSATRSIPAVRALKQAGFTDVCQLQGGMMSWESNRYPVKK